MSTRTLTLALLLSVGCATDVRDAPGTANPPTTSESVATRVAPDGPAPKSWTRLTNPAQFIAGVSLQLTDGTVMVHAVGTEQWWRLTPDINGSYRDGTWSAMASMPAGYAPTYFATSVLPDGRVIVEGGEYISQQATFSNRGAIYDPTTDTWTEVLPPAGWDRIGDASGLVLANNSFMISSAVTDQSALLDAKTLTWKPTGAGKADVHDEESWVTLPDDKVLTIGCGSNQNKAEIYDPETGRWSATISPPVALVDAASQEIGPAVLRYDGTVILFGGNGHNAVYDSKTKSYASAPDFPIVPQGQLDIGDGTAALMPNGDVLAIASPGIFQSPAHAFEWNGTELREVLAPPDAAFSTSYRYNMMLLPTGEVLLTGQSSDIQVYTPAPGVSENARPVISNVPKPITAADPDPVIGEGGGPLALVGELPVVTLNIGRSYKLRGRQLHGISHGAYYGDDAQSFTNYPLVQFTNAGTGHVGFARSYDFSTMSIRPGASSTTKFDVPTTVERGVSSMVVIANGIASPPLLVNIK
jgi:hypothetical protein